MGIFLQRLSDLNAEVNSCAWGYGIYLLLGAGIIMTVATKAFQFMHIRHWFKKTIGSIFRKDVCKNTQNKSISQFQALCTSLAATIGVGNIAGVAAAVAGGGPGAVFWMWIAAFLGMMTNYSENVLGIYYRRKNADGEWAGGAMYYLENGIGSLRHCRHLGKFLAVIFSVFCILASFGIGNMGQVNKIVSNFTTAFGNEALSSIVLYGENESAITMYHLILGIIIAAVGGVIILGGLKRIAVFAEKVVPFMVIVFLLGSFTVILANAGHILPAFSAIFESAFSAKAVWGGTNGLAVKQIITIGCKRGMFSNEAGLGSTVMVNSSSNVKEPVIQGMWGIFEVFTDTVVVCTMTALVILTSGVIDLDTGMLLCGAADDSTLVAKAFETVFGGFGEKFVAIAIFLFAFTTLLGWSHYGAMAIEYLFGKNSVKTYKMAFVIMTASGALMTSSIAWDISDTFNALMMLPNLIGITGLSGTVVKITKNYTDRIFKGIKIKPLLSSSAEIQRKHERELIEKKAVELEKQENNSQKRRQNGYYYTNGKTKSITRT